MKQRISDIIKELVFVINENGLNISDDVLFKEACSTYRGEQAGKRFSSGNTKAWSENKGVPKKDYNATDKQIAYIQELADKKNINVTIDKNLKGKEASKMIEELKKK